MKNNVEKIARAISSVIRVGSSHSGPAADAAVGARSINVAKGMPRGIAVESCDDVTLDTALGDSCCACMVADRRLRQDEGACRRILGALR